MIFAIRVDDVGWTAEASAPAPRKKLDEGLTLAKKFHAALGGLPWLAAIVPTDLDEEGHRWIASRPEGLTVALHGYDHLPQGGMWSEYFGLSYWEMRHRIRSGLRRLGVPTSHTVPPFNAMEPGFEAACADEGVKTVWGGIVDSPELPRSTAYGRYVPAFRDLYGATNRRMSKDTPILLETLPQHLGKEGYAVVTLHIPWEAARDDSFSGVRQMAKMLSGLVIDPDEFSRI